MKEHPTLKMLIEEAKATGINEKDALAGKNLSGEDLNGVNLNHFNLQKTVFNGANLSDCTLNGCSLQNAELRGCDLTNTKLRGADLSCSKLNGANLQYADLRGANLNETDVTEANFSNAYGLSQHMKHKLKAQGAFLDKNNNLWLVEKLWIPIAVGVTLAIFSAILGLIINPSQHQNNSPEFKAPITSTKKLEK
jgi:hypothetical protein